MVEIPNQQWHSRLSKERSAPFRCPYATVEACPRYYQSLALLGAAGSTRIPEAEDQRLLKHWKSSDIWPRTDEHATAIFGESDNPSIYSNFCPEVTFERFGYFATSLTRYADDLDSFNAHERFAKEGVPAGHPNWSWSSCVSQHFTDCSIYAVLAHRDLAPQRQKPEPWWRKHLGEIVVAVVVALATTIITKAFA